MKLTPRSREARLAALIRLAKTGGKKIDAEIAVKGLTPSR
jgi:hypothetical protein